MNISPKKPFLKIVFGLTLKNHGGHGFSAFSIISRNYTTAINFTKSKHCRYITFNDNKIKEKFYSLYTSDLMRYIYKNYCFGEPIYRIIPYIENKTEKDIINEMHLTKEEVFLIRNEISKI